MVGKLWLLFACIHVVTSVEKVSAQTIQVHEEKLKWKVDPRFLSVAMGSHIIGENWKNFDFRSRRLKNLASALSPAIFRIGGTSADLLIFDRKGKRSKISSEDFIQSTFNSNCFTTTSAAGLKVCEHHSLKNFTMTGKDWMRLNRFTHQVGWKLLFDVNVMLRNGRNWSMKNAKQLLQFSSRMGLGNISWELGNEPNALQHHFNVTMLPLQLGHDFRRLRRLLDRFPLYRNSTLVGPDVNHIRKCSADQKRTCKPLRYMGKVLRGTHNALDAVTWHFYYLNGHIAKLEDFLRVEVLNELQTQMSAVEKYMKTIGQQDMPLWLGETGSAFGGGAFGLSDRYVASFLWLDLLGLTAANKYSIVIRQTFYHGSYALIGEDFLPNPDYWVSLLHKRLVGTKVLQVEKEEAEDHTLRIYGHCSKGSLGLPGAVSLFAINMSNETKSFRLDHALAISSIHHYVLSAKEGNLRTRSILLNGNVMKLVNGVNIPELMPVVTGKKSELFLKAYEMAFWVFPDAGLSVCS